MAGQASAADLSVGAGCYVVAGKNAPPMAFSGSGYGPGDTVLVSSSDGTVNTTVKANAQGRISGRARAPTPYFATPSAQKIGLTASDQTPTATTIRGATTVNVTELGWEHGSTRRRPGLGALTETTNWSFSGFEPGTLIFGHYLHDGKQVTLATFGRARPPCGTLKARARLYPAKPHHLSYTIQYDDYRAYSPKSRPRIVGPLKLSP